MTAAEDRKNILQSIADAIQLGAQVKQACQLIGFSVRTYERWRKDKDGQDKRPQALHFPLNKLNNDEKDLIIKMCTNPEYKDNAPHEIVPALAEKGLYIASESSFYRVLKEADLLHHRQDSRKPQKRAKPEELVASGPNQVWSWDITYLRTVVRGIFLFLYLIMDIWSRKIVGWSVETAEDSTIAAEFFAETCLRNGAIGVRLHSDNGGPMKSGTMLATLQWLGVVPSFSRPNVSDDNPYSESLFKTLKYKPGYPESFQNHEDAEAWVRKFVAWYNDVHRHSAIKYVTPSDRHAERDEMILEIRKEVYKCAKEKHPERWSGKIRNWERPKIVVLNPKMHQSDMAVCA